MTKTFQDIEIPRTREEIEYCIKQESVFLCNQHHDEKSPFLVQPVIVYLILNERESVNFVTSRHCPNRTIEYYLPLLPHVDGVSWTFEFQSSWIQYDKVKRSNKTAYDLFGRESISETLSPLPDNLFNLFDCDWQNQNLLKLFDKLVIQKVKHIHSLDLDEYKSRGVLDKIAYIAFCLQKHQYHYGNHWEDDPKHIPEHDD